MWGVSYWVFPLVSGAVWLGTLLGLLIYWCVDTDYKHYSFMSHDQDIAYISDVGAAKLKPLFIAGCSVTTVFLDLAFISDHWLRHRGRLVPNTTTGERVLSIFTILWAIMGTCGLILLSIFDTARHPRVHSIMLLLFIVGYVLSAVCICWHIARLGRRFRKHRVLRISFYIKLLFIIVEVILAVAFAACDYTGHDNVAAVLEWAVAFIFTFYVLSFLVDLYPAVHTRKSGRYGIPAASYAGNPRQMEETGSDGRLTGADHYHGGPNGYTNGVSGSRHF